jgi:hypothetical protein
LPALLIIDRHGKVRLVHRGYDAAERLESMVNGQVAALR